MIDWAKYAPYITPEEAMCKCGQCGVESAENMDPEFLDVALVIRIAVGEPFKWTSLYRCPNHKAERSKSAPGSHARGMGGDVGCSNELAFKIAKACFNHDRIKAVRFAQKGDHGSRFIHFDIYDRGFKHVGSY